MLSGGSNWSEYSLVPLPTAPVSLTSDLDLGTLIRLESNRPIGVVCSTLGGQCADDRGL